MHLDTGAHTRERLGKSSVWLATGFHFNYEEKTEATQVTLLYQGGFGRFYSVWAPQLPWEFWAGSSYPMETEKVFTSHALGP